MSTQEFGVERAAPVVAAAEGVVEAAPEVVWGVLSDIEGWPVWNPDVKWARLDGQLSPGTSFAWKAGPGTIRSVLRVVDPPWRIGWTGSTMGISAAHVWEIDAAGAGSQVTTEESWDGFIVKLLRGMMRKQLQKSMDDGLAHLQAEVLRRAGQ